MTANQINYQRNLETMRNNRAVEFETNRSNLAKEQENYRSNTAREAENYRNNAAVLEESRRAAIARQQEIDRSNRAAEAIGWTNASIANKQADERIRTDTVNERIAAKNADTNQRNSFTSRMEQQNKEADYKSLAQYRQVTGTSSLINSGATVFNALMSPIASLGKLAPMLVG